MGSFLMSCNLTKQAINAEDEVIIIPALIKNKWETVNSHTVVNHHTVYSTDMCEPLGIMFTGRYADYGAFEIDWNAANFSMLQAFISYLQDVGVSVAQGENSYHENAFDFSEVKLEKDNCQEVWEMIHKAIWQNRLLVKGLQQDITPIFLSVVLKEYSDIATSLYLTRHVEYLPFVKALQQYEEESNSSYAFRQYGKAFIFQSGDLESSLGTSALHIIKTPLPKEYLKALYDFKVLILTLAEMNTVLMPMHSPGQDYQNTSGNLYSILMKKVHEENVRRFIEQDSEIEYSTVTAEKHMVTTSY